MMSDAVPCWRCGGILQDLILPLSRREECNQCAADQHVCKMCEHFDAATTVQCREERAEPPGNKEAANFCDYFLLRQGDGQATDNTDLARHQLNELFGETSDESSMNSSAESNAAGKIDAEAELRRLFDD